MPDILKAFEYAAKAIRSGLGAVGALVDCGIPRQHAGEQWLTEKEAEEEVAEPRLQGCGRCDGPLSVLRDGLCPSCWDYYAECDDTPLSADFNDEPCPQSRLSPECFVGSSYCLCCPHAPAAGANGSAVEDPSVGVPPAPTEADSLTHLAQCLRDAVGDHYDFACRPYDQFPFWHDDHLIDAFDWEGATTAFLEDVVRQLIDEK